MDKLTALVTAAEALYATLIDPAGTMLGKVLAVVAFINLVGQTLTGGAPKMASVPPDFHAEHAKMRGIGPMTANQHFDAMRAAAQAGANGQLLAAILTFLQNLPNLIPSLTSLLPFIQSIIALFTHKAEPVNPNVKVG